MRRFPISQKNNSGKSMETTNCFSLLEPKSIVWLSNHISMLNIRGIFPDPLATALHIISQD